MHRPDVKAKVGLVALRDEDALTEAETLREGSVKLAAHPRRESRAAARKGR